MRVAVPAATARWWRSPAARVATITYAATQSILLLWWIAFHPGTLSYDSIMYVWQATTDNWTTQHSVLYNGLVWLSLQATGGLGALTLSQTVAMAAGLSYAVTGLRALGVRARWLVVAAVAAACLPVIGTFTVYVSKDTAFVICQVWVLGTIARLVATRPRPPRRLFAILFVEFGLMALFRQNAFVVIGLTTVILVAVLAGVRWRMAATGLAAVAVSVLANAAVYPALGVRPAGSELVLGPAYADIAVAYANRPGSFTAAEEDLMASVAPLEYWSSTANCYVADDTVTYGAPEFNFAVAREREAELFELWLRLVKRMPDEMIEARLCRGSIGWNPFPGPPEGRAIKIPVEGVSSLYDFPRGRLSQSPFAGAIRSDPVNDTAHAGALFARRVSDARQFEWFAWRGATWAYISYLAVALFARRRRDVALLALAAVVAANQINVVMNNPNQLVRYMVGPIIAGVLLLPLAFARGEERPRSPRPPDRAPTPG